MATQNNSSLTKGLVFIDNSIADADTLLQGLTPDMEVVSLDSSQDGITQITDALQSFSGLASVHIISHGGAGSLALGSATLNGDSLNAYGAALEQWGSALSDSADILLYGCNVGDGQWGQSFVNRLGLLTGADIAASDDVTGSAGDWNLEYITGSIEAELAFSPEARAQYSGNLKIITVTNISDKGAGSLRAAVAAAAPGDVIRFASNLANKTIKLTSGEIFLGRDITIDATGVANLKISGDNKSRVFQVGTPQKTITATFKGLTIINGNGKGAQVSGLGGAINAANFNNIFLINSKLNNNKANRGGALQVGSGAQLTILNSSFDNNNGTLANNGKSGGAISTNSAGGAGGPGFIKVENSRFTNNRGFNGGAIYNISSPMTITNSEFLNNIAVGNGGGAIFSDGAGPGGPGTTSGGAVRIQESRFEGNQAKGGGGAVYFWGYTSDKLIVENSAILGNSVTRSAKNLARGGAIEVNGGFITLRNLSVANNIADAQGGGLWVETRKAVTIANSTFSTNQVIKDAGGALFLNTGDGTPVNIINSTLVYNEAGRANGAIWTNAKNRDDVTLRNSIVAFNTAGDHNQNQVGFTLRDGGGNIEFPAPVGRKIRVTANSQIVDPKIGPLTKIGDDWVHPLLSDSPAINTGVKRSNVPTTDQLGLARDSNPDIGAFEQQNTANQTLARQSASEPTAPSQQLSGSVIGEYGRLTLNHQWKTISLDESFKNPIVIVSDPTFNGSDPAVTRLRNVKENSFQIRLQEPNYLDGSHTNESVAYLVIESGDWKLSDGTRISAGTRSSGRLTSQGFETQALSKFNSTPTVLSQVQTFNDSDWVTTRVTEQSSGRFKFALQEEEALNGGSHASELVGWVALNSGVGNDGDTLLQGGTTGRSYNQDRSTVSLSAGFNADPSLIVKLGSYSGSDTANVRIDDITATSFGARVQEDQSLDAELSHANESLSFLALAGRDGSLTGLAA